jgi:mannosyltransferase OCH1-like enzyme
MQRHQCVLVAAVSQVYVLYLYGGIYLDVDYKLISHLDKLNLANKDAYVVCHKAEEIDNINNSIYISAKKGLLFDFMLKNITEKRQWLGPHWYAECLFKYLHLENNTSHIKIMDACVNNNIGFVDWDYLNENIVKHNFLASWYPNSEWNKKFETGNYD